MRECDAKRALQTSRMKSYFKPKELGKHWMDKLETFNMDREEEKIDGPLHNCSRDKYVFTRFSIISPWDGGARKYI